MQEHSPSQLDWRSYRYLNASFWFFIVAVLEPFFMKNGVLPLGPLTYSILVVSCAAAVMNTKSRAVVLIILGGLSIAEAVLLEDWSLLGQFVSASFFAVCAVLLLLDLWFHEEVVIDTFFGAVLGLLLVGLGFAFCFYWINASFPGSFSITAAIATRESTLLHFLYFSFVNISSMGYGDIVPLNAGARNLAALEGILGQFYFACLVARLVSMHGAGRDVNSD